MKHSVVMDSSVCIEILRKGPLFQKCKATLNVSKVLGIPTIVFFEVYKKISSTISEEAGLTAIAYLKNYAALELTTEIALTAADLAISHKLAMADSIVLSHAITTGCLLLTLDNDFYGIEGAQIIRARS